MFEEQTSFSIPLLGCLPSRIYLKIKLSSIWYCRCKTSPFQLKETTHWSCSCRGEELNDFCVIREHRTHQDQEQLGEWTPGLGIPSLGGFWSTLLSVLTWMDVNEKPFNFPTGTLNNRERISQGQAIALQHIWPGICLTLPPAPRVKIECTS